MPNMVALRTLLFTIFVPGSVTVLVPGLLMMWGWTPAVISVEPARWLGPPILFLGVCIYAWTAWDFTFTGKGTPLPVDAPGKLVVRGLYKYSRNPMYIGVLSVIVGEAFILQHLTLLIYAALVFSVFQTFIIVYEEPTLRRLFGDEYRDYCARVPRWLLFRSRVLSAQD